MAALRLEPVSPVNWRDCTALAAHPGQKRFVAEVAYYLCRCHYGDTWNSLAAVRDDEVVARWTPHGS